MPPAGGPNSHGQTREKDHLARKSTQLRKERAGRGVIGQQVTALTPLLVTWFVGKTISFLPLCAPVFSSSQPGALSHSHAPLPAYDSNVRWAVLELRPHTAVERLMMLAVLVLPRQMTVKNERGTDGLNAEDRCVPSEDCRHSTTQPHEPAKQPNLDAIAVAHGRPPRPALPQTQSSIHLPNSIMPVTASSQSFLTSLPSFMSVFGEGPGGHRARGGEALGTTAAVNRSGNVAKRPSPSSHFSSPILRRDSASTFDSTDSSPTTTISTLDSSLTEPSPSSSPESPTSSPSPSTLNSLGISAPSMPNAMDRKDRSAPPLTTLSALTRADSPNKKMRNTKNLSVNTAASTRQGPQLPKLALSTVQPSANGHPFSAPPTPSFIVPSKPPRRRPSNLGLTLSTPDSVVNGQPAHDRTAAVPPTPSGPQFRPLNYSHTSTNLPIFSPTVAPEGGMCLPPFGNTSTAGRFGKSRPPLALFHQSHEFPSSSPVRAQTLDHVQEENDYELPLSREAKSPAYPQGPVCVYEPYVYLYLEPTGTEAGEFDVVLNVAREVVNPFAATPEQGALPKSQDAATQVPSNPRSTFAGRRSISEPQTAIADHSFHSAFEAQLEQVSESPRGTPAAPRQTPEYFHIPWDHNTNVVDDLARLCELIDDRVRQKKRVLVHCQCGVSRSASLVVAYGLYKNPQLTVQEAYNMVKGQSRWIGPNMNLIYQLSEFKSKLQRTGASSALAWHPWRSYGPGRPDADAGAGAGAGLGIAAISKSSLPASSFHDSPTKSLSAPFQKAHELGPARASSLGTPSSSKFVETSPLGDVTPGPSSAPPSILWSPRTLTTEPAAEAERADESRTSHEPPERPTAMELDPGNEQPLPAVNTQGSSDKPTRGPSSILPCPPTALAFSSLTVRRNAPHHLPIRQELPSFTGRSAISADHPMLLDDVPQSPSLLSPRAAEFTATPFHRTVAGDLAGSSVFEQGLLSPKPRADDPRSPAGKGEAAITRNIFELL